MNHYFNDLGKEEDSPQGPSPIIAMAANVAIIDRLRVFVQQNLWLEAILGDLFEFKSGITDTKQQ